MHKWLLIGLLSIGLLVSLGACRSASTTLTTCSSDTTTVQPPEACLLTGYLVKNPQGDLLGRVKNLFLDTEQGQIAYLALAFDDPGVHSKGAMILPKEKIALIPWHAVTVVPGETVLLLNLDQRSLIDLPHFDQMPEGVSSELAAKIRQRWVKTEYRQ